MNPTVQYLLLTDESMCAKSTKRKEEIAHEIDVLVNEHPDETFKAYTMFATAAGRPVDHEAVRHRLKELSNIVSLSHIATEYLHRSPSWLSQRVKGALIHGKPAEFSRVQLLLINLALEDIAHKIGSVSLLEP